VKRVCKILLPPDEVVSCRSPEGSWRWFMAGTQAGNVTASISLSVVRQPFCDESGVGSGENAGWMESVRLRQKTQCVTCIAMV
jgi:hypothetical protein